MPMMLQAGIYSAVTTYLKAVKETGTDDAKVVLNHMRKMEINDIFAKASRSGKMAAWCPICISWR